MAKIVVFDSGLGSLSIIREIQKICKAEIIYFGDQKNFPYGEKSKSELKEIIENSIEKIKDKFKPDLIVVGSNTPTIMLNIENNNIIGVKPPIKEAEKISKTKNIAILGTRTAVESNDLSKFIKKCNLDPKTRIHKINGSVLVELVEAGIFPANEDFCKKKIIKIVKKKFIKEKIDTVTLSSTHLSFLKVILEEQFPEINFIDPGYLVAKKINKKIKNIPTNQNRLKIFCSGDIKKFQNKLMQLGIKNKVNFLST